ncbi:MAG: phosphopentomutase [Acidimicrobiia bacterium]|nr:MAG: phosphopentomutase [Acidimicrobiia bacterium]
MIGRAVVVVMDSCGAGAAPDASKYGDEGSDTLGHVARAVGGLHLPNFEAAGLGNLHGDLAGVPPVGEPTMAFGKMSEASAGKDSTTGHWEIAGLVTDEPFATFTDTGFPEELVEAVEHDAGVEFIGNRAASGTVIIEELGEEHLRTGRPILYTSADSVFQIAAHKDVVPLEELYRICRIARRHCDRYRIGRVIARPFEGPPGGFRRTYERKDFAMEPDGPTLLDHASAAGLDTFGVGKIEDLFAGRGLSATVHTEGDADGLARTLEAMRERPRPGIVFTNLVDLDMLYGHREDPHGYASGLAIIDRHLPALVEALGPDDLLFVTADHGNDPTDGSTDHTREYVPLLVAGGSAAGVDLGVRSQFGDVAATIAEGFGLPPLGGTSFLAEVL